MFLYPLSRMTGGILYEHSHRLIGSIVGLLTIVLAMLLWVKEERKWLRWLGVVAICGVIVQGVLGGLRVITVQQILAIVHAGFAQAFFALILSIVLFTSREWTGQLQGIEVTDAQQLRRLCVITTLFIYLQLIFGALLTHTGMRLDAHLFFAVLIVVHVILLAVRIIRGHADQPKLVYPVIVLGGLLLLQLILGVMAYMSRFTTLGIALPSFGIVSLVLHRITGTMIFATCFVLTLRAYRLLTLFYDIRTARDQTQR
jgi:cytochrome c oxidase assembly protein subunit 15